MHSTKDTLEKNCNYHAFLVIRNSGIAVLFFYIPHNKLLFWRVKIMLGEYTLKVTADLDEYEKNPMLFCCMPQLNNFNKNECTRQNVGVWLLQGRYSGSSDIKIMSWFFSVP